MSRKPDPTTPYHVRDNYDKGYHYAYVQRVVETDKGPVRRKINIGTLKEQNVFVPNNTLRLMNVEERRLLIFPEDWDITLVTSLDQKQTKKETLIR